MNRRGFLTRLLGVVTCTYCSRSQVFADHGGCVSCGAALPVPVEPPPPPPTDFLASGHWVEERMMIDITTHNDDCAYMIPGIPRRRWVPS